MTTTPTFWTSFNANPGATAGRQYWPTTIGLANGNILVVWTDEGNAANPGADQFGQMFNALGEAIGPPIAINTRVVATGETLGEIAAMPDGGFIITYQSGAGLVVERHAANGFTVFSDIIGTAGSTVAGVAVLANGSYCVNFIRDVGFFGSDYDIFGVIYDGATNARSAVFDAARNSGDDDNFDSIAGLAAGGAVTTYSVDGNVEFRVVDNAGNRVIGGTVVGAGRSSDVAALANGNFAVAYERGGDIKYRVISPEGGASPELVAADGANNQNEPSIVALKDGGFFIAWDDDSGGLVNGRRFDESGEPLGDFVQIAASLGADASPFVTTHPDLGLTSDGRILVSFINAAGEISEVIFDPRDTTIFGTAGDDVITTQVLPTTVFAGGGNDTVFGRNATDLINGGAGNDRIFGGGGIDTVLGGEGDDTFVIREGENSDHVNGGAGLDRLDLGLVTGRGANINLASGAWTFSPGFGEVIGRGVLPQLFLFETRTITGVEIVTGTRVADSIIGSVQRDILSGRSGNDQLSGNAGDDALAGEEGNDTLDGGDGNDFINDGAGDDTVRGGAGDDRIIGVVGADNYDGGAGFDEIDYSFGGARVRVALDGSFAGEADSLGDIFTGIEQVRGTVFGDVIRGDNAANFIDGHAGSDTLQGLGGDDTILSDTGSDVITGGAGNDTFHYRIPGGGADTIKDFSNVLNNNDRFTFVGSAFGGLLAGPLDPARFTANLSGVADSAAQRFVYETDTGILRFDADGNIPGGTTIVATLTGVPALTAADIFIV